MHEERSTAIGSGAKLEGQPRQSRMAVLKENLNELREFSQNVANQAIVNRENLLGDQPSIDARGEVEVDDPGTIGELLSIIHQTRRTLSSAMAALNEVAEEINT